MAEKKQEAAAAEAPKKGLPIKAMGVLLAVLLIEGLAISGVFMLAGRPADVKADPAAQSDAEGAERPVEVLVITEKFQNTRSGRTYIYDTEIFVVIRQKHSEKVKKQLEGMSAQVAADIGTLFRRAEPTTLLEPTLSTLTRQIKAVLDERLGNDEEGKPLTESVLIKKYTQFRADS